MNKTSKLVLFVVLILAGLVAFKFVYGMFKNVMFIAIIGIIGILAYRFVFGSKKGSKK